MSKALNSVGFSNVLSQNR